MQTFLTFATRGRMLAVAGATLLIVGLGLGVASITRSSCSQGTVEVECPTDPIGPDGRPVGDRFYFAHQPMGPTGSITVRLVSMTGTITYPPPDHDEIVIGLVPWAKAGIIIKDGVQRGSPYAALMMTGSHGVRMQHNYTEDRAGSAGSGPRWLRLARAGDTITGYESADGVQWAKVGEAVLRGLPQTVRVGLFATSPGDLTLRRTGLGASLPQSRFTQASAEFDSLALEGVPGGGRWEHGSVGEMGHTDWEKFHRAPGFAEAGGKLTITGTGDIGPAGEEAGFGFDHTLLGLSFGLIVLLVIAVRFGHGSPHQALGARAAVAGGVGVLCGLVAAGTLAVVGVAVLRANGNSVHAVPVLTQVRVVVGVGVLFGLAVAFAVGLGALMRRRWAAVLIAICAVVLPYMVSAVPLLPDELARWLLRVTPAAGFAVLQTAEQYRHVIAHYAPSAGYFPLPWWAGLGLLACFAALAIAAATARQRRHETRWR